MAGKKLSIPKQAESGESAPPTPEKPEKKPRKAAAAPPVVAPEPESSGAPPSSWSVLGRIALVLAACASLAAVAWQYIGDTVRQSPSNYVEPSHMIVNAAPAWVRGDIGSEVVKAAGMREPLLLLDPQLAERVAKEFSMHAWVEKVERVRLERPSKIFVDVLYRSPTAMVEVPGGLYPVDRFGVLLPSADFSPIEAARFPRLGGATATPGAVGALWGDPVVIDGAKLAALLLPQWENWRLFRIAAAERDVLDAPDARPSFIITTRSNKTRILWGVAPEVELSSQPTAQEKLERLSKYVADLGSLDHSTEPREIDLRPTDRPRVTPVVAQNPR